ncbi:putative P-loop containing nucleoside triphosphate hydrolase [Dioscorea sansibarensis]
MYDAYDVIDLCMIEGSKLLEDDGQLADSTCFAVRCSFSLFSCVHSVPFRHEIANRVKSLNDILDQILNENNKFKFEESASTSFHVTRRDCSHQSSLLPELDMVGWNIRDDSQKLVKLLIGEDEQKCSVFAITGFGRIGKTTLAQVIYNESKIKEGLMQHSWIFVSRDYLSEIDILKGILRNIDDVWKEDVWVDLLRNPVESGAAKIRILVTTRDKNVVEKMGAVHIHNVSKLSVEDG